MLEYPNIKIVEPYYPELPVDLERLEDIVWEMKRVSREEIEKRFPPLG